MGAEPKLGSPKGASHLRGRFQPHAVEAVQQQAQEKAQRLRPVIEDIKASGITSARKIAEELNARCMMTPPDVPAPIT